MLPLISNVLPQTAATQATTVAAASAAFSAAQAATASRPLTPVAVSAAGAATAFSTQLPARRNETSAPRFNLATPQPDRPIILPDPEFWKVPTRLAGEQIAPMPPRQQLIGNIIPQVVQYTTQAAAQETPVVKQEQPQPQPASTRRLNALMAKKPGVGDATGFRAYDVAAQRSLQMSLPSTVEAVI